MELIPEAEFEWRPGRGFSFGDLLRHLAGMERYMFAETSVGRPSAYPGHDASLAPGYAATHAYYQRLRDETTQILERMHDDDLARVVTTPAGTQLANWKWLRAMVEHEVHHRGQIYMMLGMVGVGTPPMFGLTSEEVRARSVPFSEDPFPATGEA